MRRDQDMGYSKGGIVGGVPVSVSVKRLPDCPKGHAVFSIAGGPPEHIVSGAEARRGDTAQIECQQELEGLDDAAPTQVSWKPAGSESDAEREPAKLAVGDVEGDAGHAVGGEHEPEV